MNEIEIKVLSKISELEDIIESAGKHWQETKDYKDLLYVCRRIEAKNLLHVYLKSL